MKNGATIAGVEIPFCEAVEAANGSLDLSALESRSQPLILKGLVSSWPAVDCGAGGIYSYLSDMDKGAVVQISVGPPDIDGRVFYTPDFGALNVDQGNATFNQTLRQIETHGGAARPPLIYLASTEIDRVLPAFREQNDLEFGARDPLASIWIGTPTLIAAHNDLPLNIACVVAGRRRFTLFPPDQTENLYLGPFELTPAGRPISFVDFRDPDLSTFPKAQYALGHAQIADLEPGDAIFIPSMWWHQVEASGAFNVLVNYWWRTVPNHLGTPQDALHHAILAIRDLPTAERDIWRDIFEHYVFGASDEIASHIPADIQGQLAKLSPEMADKIRKFLVTRLSR